MVLRHPAKLRAAGLLIVNRIALFAALFVLPLVATRTSTAFELRDQDRVVLLGDALIEQAQYNGWSELMLTTAFPDRHVTFRNLGWSGDTPAGASRFGLSLLQAGREPADEGWKQLQKQLELTQPTVLILGYGTASALEGKLEGLERFKTEYGQLLRFAKEISPEVRFIFLSPLRTTLDDDTQTQKAIAAYSNAVEEIAADQQSPFVDLSSLNEPSSRKDPVHLSDLGYQRLAERMAESLGLQHSQWKSTTQAEALRQIILRKNQWWFHRSRPANMAYVFGFRKREQGQNAVEIPQFDSLIQQEEERIAQLRSLQDTELDTPEPQLKSQFAEFQEQPKPEFTIDNEWEISLWAENPLLNKPIHMNFDPAGRLWIASSEAYPMIEVGQSAPDRILVLEDTDQDGRADQSQVFAEGLLIPTGIAPGDGGVYVAQSTDLLFLKDTNGDGVADQKTCVLSGFGTEDTHHNLHTLRWGPDGCLYMNQSVYTRTDAETPHNVVRLKAGGGFRYNTQTMQMDIFFRGLWNSWGHQFDAFGQSFLSDGAGFAGLAYTFPGATFNPTPKARHILDLISPGRWPKFASLEIIEGENFPADWQGSLITCDFRANRVTRFSVTEQSAGFVTQQEDDLVRTSAATFRPIDVKQGPDGALYIADWSNPIINHGEVDFRDPRRDRWHGRIWRAVWKGATPKVKVDLTQLDSPALFERLLSADRYDKEQAKRVLIERARTEAEKTHQAIADWTKQLDSDADHLQALWLWQSINVYPVGLLNECLAANDARVRAAAVRVAANLSAPTREPAQLIDQKTAVQLFAKAMQDSHPRVRLEAITGLTRHRSPESAKLILTALDRETDRFIEHALAIAIDELAPIYLAELENGAYQSEEDSKQLEFLLGSLEPTLSGEFLANRFASQLIPEAGPWIELVAKAGDAEQLQKLLNQVVQKQFNPAASTRALKALLQAQRTRKVRPAQVRDIATILDFPGSTEADMDLRLAAIELAGTWKAQAAAETLIKTASDETDERSLSLTAIRALGEIGGPRAIETLKKLASANGGRVSRFRQEAILSLARVQPDLAVQPTLSFLSNASEQDALRFWRNVLGNRGFGKRVASELSEPEPEVKLSNGAALAGLQATRDGGRNEPELQAALSGLVETESLKLTPELLASMTKQVANGDPARGELIYRRQELACSNCHAIGGVGGKVGPDMTSLGASAPVDYLIESLFDPNAKIKENYHSVTVVTEDDLIVTGIEIDSNDEALTLRNANDELVRIPQADILLKKDAQSLMPVGVIDRLPRQDQIDLVAFLSQLGKPGRFDASEGGVARIFEIFAGTHRREQDGMAGIIDGTTVEGWIPVPTRVNGDLPKEWIEEKTRQPINIALVNVYARTRIEVSKPGQILLSLPTQAAVWIDGIPVESSAAAEPKGSTSSREDQSAGSDDGHDRSNQSTSFTPTLTAGQHSVLVRLDARSLPKTFRLESDDVAFVGLSSK